MADSPSGLSNGRTPTPNGGPPRIMRRPKAADPMRTYKKKPERRVLGAGTAKAPVAPSRNLYPVNGTAPLAAGPQALPVNGAYGGWTHPPAGQYTDYPLFTTKRALREGLRHHVMRFSTKKVVDPADQDEFPRPVTLHRRDPKQPVPGRVGKVDEMDLDLPMDSKEREKLEIAKAEKDAKRAADLAQIAPTGNNPSAMAAKKNQSFRNEKTTQVHRLDKTEEEKKASDLRYEEALPWHLEDADNKNTWVGTYEAALSDTNVMFVVEQGRFLMVPIEKWYKFTAKGQFKVFTIEEAEAKMNKKTREPRWVMKEKEAALKERLAPTMHKIYSVKAESNTFKGARQSEMQDMDELDFAEGDLFQDDDEQATVEPDNDEETKEMQDRIKRDQLAANIFDQANEAEVEKEIEEALKEIEESKQLAKKTRKALTRREKNLIYESDSDNPYSDSSEDDTSDEEKQKEIDKKKDEEAKLKEKAKDSKLPSGASSKGTNTPSGRPKHTDPLKKPKNSLKRPGSPNLSESSGNESTHKKHKKKHNSSSASGRSTPIPGSRPMSPVPSASQPGQQGRKSSVVKLNVPASKLSEIQSAPPNPSPATYGGSMSDAEATGGEMSDVGKKKKIKLRVGGSPTGSRAVSPDRGRAGSAGDGGRAGSPASPTAAPTADPQTRGSGPLDAREIAAAVPPEGILIGALMKLFRERVGDAPNQTTKKDFIRLVKDNANWGPDKLLRPK